VQYLVKELSLPSDIVPATFKKKKSATAGGPRVKEEGDDEKPEAEETARPTGLGRGAR